MIHSYRWTLFLIFIGVATACYYLCVWFLLKAEKLLERMDGVAFSPGEMLRRDRITEQAEAARSGEVKSGETQNTNPEKDKKTEAPSQPANETVEQPTPTPGEKAKAAPEKSPSEKTVPGKETH